MNLPENKRVPQQTINKKKIFLYGQPFSGNRLSATTLCADKIFIAHSYNTSTGTSVSQYSLYGMVCTISGTAISHGTDTQLVNNEYAGKKISAVALSSSKVFVAHSYGNYLYAYCTVCTINGTAITSGTSVCLSSTSYSGDYAMSAVKLSPNKAFVAFDNNSAYIFGIVCAVDGTTVTLGTLQRLTTQLYAFDYFNVVTINEDKIFIIWCYNTSYAYSMECIISGTEITSVSVAQMTAHTSPIFGRTLSGVWLGDNKIFMAHSYIYNSYYMYGAILSPFTKIETTNSTSDGILGVAKTNAVAGATVDLYVPNI